MRGLVLLFLAFTVCLAVNRDFLDVNDVQLQDNTFLEFMKGFLEGINEKGDINKLMACIKSGEAIINKIIEALNILKKITLENLIKGITMLIEAITELMNALKPCMEGFDQLKKLFNAITHANIKAIAMRILMHPAEFLGDVTKGIECFAKKDFHCLGKCVGDLMRIMFLSRRASNPIQDFVDGFLKGIREEKGIEDLLKCMKNADQILEKIKTALALIKKFTLESLLQGLSMLFESIFDLEEMLRPCLGEFTQFKKLIIAIADADIEDIITKIMQNPMQFIADISDCIDALTKREYLRAGKDIGDVLYRLFLVEMTTPKIDVFQFVKGFLEGINEKGDINELLKCVKDLEHIITKIIEAINYIKKMDITNLIKGITLLFEAITELLNIFKPCSEGFEQIKKLIQALSHIDIMKIIFKILANPGPYIQDVTDAIDAFQKNDGYRAGKDIGDVLYRLFLASFSDKITFEEFVKIMEGFLKGINQSGNFKDITECLKKVPLIVEMVIEVIDIMKTLDWTDMSKLLELVFKLIADYNEILVAIKDCSTTPEEIEKILEKIKNISIDSIQAKLIANAWHLIIAINGAVENLKEGHYADFGYKVGDIFYVLIIE